MFLPLDARWLDVESFRQGAGSGNLHAWLQALSLYQGDLLEGNYDDWLVVERESLYLQYIRLLHRACHRLLQEGRFADVLPLAERLVQAETYDERALRLLMQAYHEMGRRGAALAAYDRFVALAADELGVEPEAATQALAQAIRSPDPLGGAAPQPAVSEGTSPDAVLRLAREALWQGNRDAAQGYLSQVQASPGYRDDACLLEVDIALSLGEHRRAKRLLSVCHARGAPQLARQAWLALGLHDAALAHDAATGALLLAYDSGDKEAQLEALLALASAQQQAGQHAQGIRSAEQALSLARKMGSYRGIVQALSLRGSGKQGQGRHTRALSDFYEARSVALEHGLRLGLVMALRGIRLALANTGQQTAALAAGKEELSISRDLGLERQEAEALEGLAIIQDYLGRSADSLRAMGQALEVSKRVGDPVRLAISRYNLAYALLYHDDANASRAASEARESLSAFRVHSQTGWEAAALTALGYALWVGGQYGKALGFFREAHAASAAAGEWGYLPELLAYQGLAHLGLKQYSQALSLTRRAVLALAQGEVSQEVTPEIYYAHALALSASGEEDQARVYFAQAYESLLAGAAQLADEAARQAYFHRNPTTRRLMQELYAREMAQAPAVGIITRQIPAAQGERLVQVRWTVDAGPSDAALRQAKGAIALRRSRLARLLREARSQGASPTVAHLAEALGVSKRTIQRDLATLRSA